MRNLHLLDGYRRTDQTVMAIYGGIGDASCGVFDIPSPIDGRPLMVVASTGEEWEHVSASRSNRIPNWPEMCRVKGLFFRDDEVVMQLHVPSSDHVNDCVNCLHLWRPTKVQIPRPPKWMVGGMSLKEAKAAAAVEEAA